jgi:hypothetical protein
MKSLIYLFLLMVIATSSLAFTLGNEQPLDGSSVNGLNVGFHVANTDSDAVLTTGTVYINTAGVYVPQTMTCAGYSCDKTIDMSLVPDNSAFTYFFSANSIVYPLGSYFTATISRPPQQVTGLDAQSISESEIRLDWTANIESDINHYNIYKDSILLTTSLTNTFTDGGLTIGDNHCYEVSAVDNDGNEGLLSVQDCALVQDLTPPTAPSITNTVSNIKPINTNIDYSESVSLRIISGAVLIQDLGNGQNFVFTTNPVSYGTRNFQALACDSYSNCLTTDFSVTYQGAPVIINANTVDVPFWNEPMYTMVKGDALTDGSDYWIMKMELAYYKYCNIRPSIPSDIVGGSGAVMLVDEEIQPATSCDANALVLDYYLDNTADLLQASLDGTCVDLDPSGYISKTMYLKVPVKAGVPVDSWTWSIDWDGDVC